MENNRVTESLFYLFKDFVSYITGGSTCIGCGSGTLSLPLCKSCQAVLRNYQSFKIPCKSELHFKSRCKICGKINNVNVFETEREDGGFYRMLTFDDVFQKLMNALSAVKIPPIKMQLLIFRFIRTGCGKKT